MAAIRVRLLGSAARAALRGIRATPLIFALSVTTMSAGLLLLGTYLLVVQNMRDALERFGADLQVVAFLRPDTPLDPESQDRLRARVAALEGVGEVRFVSRDQALEQLRQDLGEQASILEGLARNPLPASFEIEVTPESRSPEAVRALVTRLNGIESIEDTRYGEDWVEAYGQLLRAVLWLGAGLGSILVLVLGTVVVSTVRLGLYARADEIQIQRLVGADGLFVRLPFYLEGALQGALAAVASLGLLYGLFRLGLPALGDLLAFLLGRPAPSFLGIAELTLLLLVGVGLGLGGAVVSLLRLEAEPR